MLAGGLDGGAEQFPLSVSPTEYRPFSKYSFGSPSSMSKINKILLILQ